MKQQGDFLKQIHYLAVEGAIGAGKTSFASLLAARLTAKLILEEVEENPFIQKFYNDRGRYAFQTQLFFLLSRYRQQLEIGQKDLFHQIVVSDYMFAKDRIFANLNLNENEFSLYDRVAEILETHIPKPDFIIYLQATGKRLLKNVRERNRTYESSLEPEYIESVNEAYNHFFFNYTDAPVLIVDATEIDFVRNAEEFDEILKELNKGGKGTRYFKPLTHVKK
ncbi:MAG: deoxyadenosine kinase [Candidatus Raymondbacteria bacterium RifOxyA12_full_50_37]|uniref:Deoxyadenosine kinase n=1 Tax=Candidatus Raymondbacteria bacterium RIFOXYD12_FULL_49_13 TaxID=1817890 RepID=A0A1F7F8Z9_UNCRA|nr:MAG: deoxyadenosine kinase [Candidatus Raymondbacteria bacterium RifOxyA12_full_50_37]OGJ85433.1 MAG: deoxyadenosine kinase [Candidatus Raymondbacteria bacterium RIFOXYA2_FULL_49_16]OGJ91047.1 MAG: deoxyadenosine kinase [Candidatus Raymondbacteria bacterium RifOxyB12_full_50_8]OGJ94941.1 MAG: deoxyadenosine kinase [Candidatus Raymondbacteria bacterium RIFOXYC2_FULL_50_21]OGK03058.1 MAG: deoxyadenosine kinase [Candidatus Raymondbacteria bacterium RIFOXYD12_FULL_49_13]OGP45573.1 MAG: deoxyade